MRVDKFRCRDRRRPCPCRAHKSLSAVAPCSYLSLRLVLRPRRLMRIRATGKEIREGSSYGKSTVALYGPKYLYRGVFVLHDPGAKTVLRCWTLIYMGDERFDGQIVHVREWNVPNRRMNPLVQCSLDCGRVALPNWLALAILQLLQPDFRLLTERDSGVLFYDFFEIFRRVRSACLDDFPRLPFAFAPRKETGAGNR